MVTFLICVATYFAIGIIPAVFGVLYGIGMTRGPVNWTHVAVMGVLMWVLWPWVVYGHLSR